MLIFPCGLSLHPSISVLLFLIYREKSLDSLLREEDYVKCLYIQQ